MKYNKLGRNILVTGLSAVMAFGLFACSRDYYPDYVYTTSAATGTISAFAVDYETGIPNQIAGSPFATQLSNPISAIASPNNQYLYEIGGTQNSQVEMFGIGTDGKLYGTQTVNITGTYPTGAAINSAGTFLFVTYEYQIGYGPNSPGPGGLTIFPIGSDGKLGTAINVNLGTDPVGVAVTVPIASQNDDVFVYVAEQATTTSGEVLEYQLNTSTGALTALSSSGVAATEAAGVTPSAISSEPTGRYLYVTDRTSNEIYGYQILAGGTLLPMTTNPTATGLYPDSIAVDPRGDYLYVANNGAGTVSSYNINQGTGALGAIATSFQTGPQPTCVTIDPALGIYLFTSNYLDNSISAASLKPENGDLSPIAEEPFQTGTLPSCVVAVANGSHAVSIVNPN